MADPVAAAPPARSIGELRERSLHAALKRWYALPHDRAEVPLGGYVIDLVRRSTLIEIQTRGFAKLARKLTRLVSDYRVRLVFPIAQRKWIVTTDPDGRMLRRRASPKRGAYRDLFAELMRIPHLIGNPNFTLEALLVEVEEVRCADGRGSWRRRGISVVDTRLLEVCDRRRFRTPADFARLLPPESGGTVHQSFAGRDRRHARVAGRHDDLHATAHGRHRAWSAGAVAPTCSPALRPHDR